MGNTSNLVSQDIHLTSGINTDFRANAMNLPLNMLEI